MTGITGKHMKKYRGNITAAFGADIFVNGVTGVPNLLLRFYKNMGITDSQMMILLQMLRFINEEKNLYPTPENLAGYLSADVNQVERDINELLAMDILAVTEYYDAARDMVCNGYDFEPLFVKISEAWACAKVREIEKTEALLEKRPEVATPLDLSGLFRAFEREFGRPLSPMEIEQVRVWSREVEQNLVLEALRRAVMLGKHNFKYIDSILLEWRKNNLRTVDDIARYDDYFQQRRGNKPRRAENGRDNDKKKEAIKSLYMS